MFFKFLERGTLVGADGLAAEFHRELGWNAVHHGQDAGLGAHQHHRTLLGRVFHRRLVERYEEEGALPSLILLGNHGILTIADTAEGAEAISLMAVKSARVRLRAHAAGGTAPLTREAVEKYVARDDISERRQHISGTVGRGCGLELDRWIQPGDVVELEIARVGLLRTPIGQPR